MTFTATTQGIVVTAEPHYQPRYSKPEEGHHVFSYYIRIENQSPYTVQLLSRHWKIFDGIGQHRVVEGEGVIGEQPIIGTGSSHYYTSWCPIQGDLGSMQGWFSVERQEDGISVQVEIPCFELIVPYRLN